MVKLTMFKHRTGPVDKEVSLQRSEIAFELEEFLFTNHSQSALRYAHVVGNGQKERLVAYIWVRTISRFPHYEYDLLSVYPLSSARPNFPLLETNLERRQVPRSIIFVKVVHHVSWFILR